MVQCGGIAYNGSTSCIANLTCYIQNVTYSACLKTCPIGWQCAGKYIIFKENKYVLKIELHKRVHIYQSKLVNSN